MSHSHLLFLTVKSSSDGFLSGFLFGSSFFMFLGLLLMSYKQTHSSNVNRILHWDKIK